MKFGKFKAIVNLLAISISANKPAIFIRISAMDEDLKKQFEVVHRTQLSNPDSQRIGFDELRSCFPNELANLNDVELLTYLIANTSKFEGREVGIDIIEQKDKLGKPVRSETGESYYNVRLHSAVRDMDKENAKAMAIKLLQGIEAKKFIDEVFNET